jgi:hypothetical protein
MMGTTLLSSSLSGTPVILQKGLLGIDERTVTTLLCGLHHLELKLDEWLATYREPEQCL